MRKIGDNNKYGEMDKQKGKDGPEQFENRFIKPKA